MYINIITKYWQIDKNSYNELWKIGKSNTVQIIEYSKSLYPFYKMCGDIMITTKNKTKGWSSALVISIMCAVIMTIIRQSLNNHTYTYAWISRSIYTWSQQIHTVASDPALSIQWFRNVFDDVSSLVVERKKLVHKYLWWIQDIQDKKVVGNIPNSWSVIQTWSLVWFQQQKALSTASEYIPFEDIKKWLSDKKCKYPLPVDSTDSKITTHIQWWLEHCLITVSSAQKVYPNDILTHDMMRNIANRAWFSVNMNYISRKPVNKEQFLMFFYELQQQHKIGDLPVVPMSSPLKRSEYIIFLHKIFWDEGDTKSYTTWSVSSDISKSTIIFDQRDSLAAMTVKEFKELLASQWREIMIIADDEFTLLTPDIVKKILLDKKSVNSMSWHTSVWVDKEMMKQTLSRFIQKL